MTAFRAGVTLLAASAALAAAEPQQNPLRQQPPIFRAGVERVRLHVVVTDRGRPVTQLAAPDFEVRDNGVLSRDVEIVSAPGHVSVAIALDLSDSVEDVGLTELRNACAGLVDALAPDDVAWLVTFSDELALEAGPAQDPAVIRSALSQLHPRGGTRMWDALIGAVSLVQNQRGRSLVVLFTDGDDTTSWLDEDPAIDTLKRADVVVNAIRPRAVPYYAVPQPAIPRPMRAFDQPVAFVAPRGFVQLEAAAKATGGQVLTAEKDGRLRDQFVALLDEFRMGYVLSFTPTHYEPHKDGWHRLEVKLKDKPGSVRTRPGYYVARK